MREIAYLIPAYRPDAALPDLLRRLRALTGCPIIVVDDGSGGGYAAAFEAARTGIPGLTILRHEANRGKGRALQTGLAWARALPGLAGVVTLDADGQHRPEDAVAIGAALQAQGAALVLGCRDFGAGQPVPLCSRFGNLLTRHVFRWLTGIALTDSQTGLRGIPAALIGPLLALSAGRYEFETAMLLLAARGGTAIRQVPVQTIYIDGNAGSHFDPVVDSLRIYAVLARFGIARLAAKLPRASDAGPTARRGVPER